MNDPEAFITRWSRRKREALRETDESASSCRDSVANSSPPPCVEAAKGEGEEAAGPVVPAPVDPAFDPAGLPPIESIAAETDIRAFLAPGVPSDLTRAALRRTWVSDPGIRNFVGLADYDWDFNAADAVAGFGPLPIIEGIGKTAARFVENASACAAPDSMADRTGAAAEIGNGTKLGRDQPVKEAGTSRSDEIQHRLQDVIATQDENAKPVLDAVAKRRHGGALPQD